MADPKPAAPDTSVVDAEALRHLRAVQRMTLQGAEGSSALVGGTIAAGGIAAVQAGPPAGAMAAATAPARHAAPAGPAAAPDVAALPHAATEAVAPAEPAPLPAVPPALPPPPPSVSAPPAPEPAMPPPAPVAPEIRPVTRAVPPAVAEVPATAAPAHRPEPARARAELVEEQPAALAAPEHRAAADPAHAPTTAPEPMPAHPLATIPEPTLAQPPVAATDPAPVERPVATPDPVPVELDVVTPGPVADEPPIVTPDPAPAGPPIVTPDPMPVELPVVTPDPELIEPPVVTPDPEPVEPPVVTPDPVPAEPPIVTHDPEPAEPPVVTPDPLPVEPPVVTPDPEPAEPPVVTPDPLPVEPPVVTPDPEPVEPPAVTPDPVPAEPPVVLPDPLPPEPPVVTPDPTPAEPPVVTPDPELAEPPVVTPEPTPAEPPVVTPDPVPVGPPVVTPDPLPSEPPVVTPDPTPAEPPVVTPDPEPTEPPVVIPEPTPAEPPVVTPDPVPVEPPVVTPDPLPSEPPVITPDPTPVEPPVVTPGTEPVEPPVVTPDPTPAEPPVITPDPTPAEPPVVIPEPTPAEPPIVTPDPTPAEPPVVIPDPTPAEPPVVAPDPTPAEPPVVTPDPVPTPPPAPPRLAVEAAHGLEDAAIALHLSAEADPGPGGSLELALSGLPQGASLSAGTRQANGSWLLSAADLPGLTLTAPADFAGQLDLTLRATTRDAGGESASSEAPFRVTVAPVVDGAVLAGMAAGSEDQWITLDVTLGRSTDASEAWDELVLVHGVPPGALLSQGDDLGDGIWAVAASALAARQVAIRPPADASGRIALTLEGVLRDHDGTGASKPITTALEVQVAAMADAPRVSAADAAGREDEGVLLQLGAALADTDGSESLSLALLGLPAGARLSAGTLQADGSWSLAAMDLDGLRLLLPADASATLSLTLRATAREATGGTATSDTAFTVRVAAVADSAILAAGGEGEEDGWIPLRGTLALRDTDGSERFGETLSVRGLPAGARLSHGAEVAPGEWEVPLEAFRAGLLAVLPPANSDADLRLTFAVTTIDSGGGTEDRAVTEAAVTVVVRAVADAPLLAVADLQGREDVPLRLVGLGGTLRDTDGSETLGFLLDGLPAGATLSAGTRQADGSWRLTPEQLATAVLTPPPHFSGAIPLVLTAVATEEADSRPSAATAAAFTLHLAPVADTGSIAGSATGAEDTLIVLRPVFSTPDADSSESWGATTRVAGLPAGAVLSQGSRQADGSWQVSTDALRSGQVSVTPPANSDADFTLTFTTVLADQGDGQTDSREISGTHAVRVVAVADAPVVQVADFQGSEDTLLRLAGLGGALRDTDGSETLSFQLSGLPAGANLSAGTRQADGSWLLTPAQLAAVSLAPPAQFSGQFSLTLTAIATEREDGQPSARTAATFTVSLDPVADAGTISGKVTGREDTAIVLRPAFATPDGDGSESWSATSLVAGLPAGAVLSQGSRQADGSWQVSTAALRAGQISVMPAADSDADFTLRITATLSDTGNGKTVSRVITGSYAVTVLAVADAPVAVARNVSGLEDQPIALDLAAALRDTDGSETLSVSLLGVPKGATLSRGQRKEDGSWALAASDLPGLMLTAPRDFSGNIALTLKAVAADRDSSTATTTAAFTVQVAAVADAPLLRTSGAAGAEDTAIALHASAVATDLDGSETVVAFRLAGVPAGAVVRAGGAVLAAEADGSVLVAPAAMDSLSITPPLHSDRGFTLRISAISAEPNGSRAESAPVDLPVAVRAVADAPLVAGRGGTGREDTAIVLDLGATLVDTDGSETLTVLVGGLPPGARLTAGTWRGGGEWALTAAEARNVSLLPPADFAGTIALRVTAVAQEAAGVREARTTAVLPVTVTVAAVVDAPAVGGLDGHSGDWGIRRGAEDRPIALRLDPGLADRDGSEQVVGSVVLGGIPPGAVLRLADGSAVAPGADGLWRIDAAHMAGVTLAPPPDSDAAIALTVRMTVEDTGGVRQEIGGRLLVQPQGVADAPLLAVQDAAGAAGDWVPLAVDARLADADGSETLWLWVRDLPPGFQLSAGRPAEAGGWLLPATALPGLAVRAPDGFDGSVTLRLQAMAEEQNGDRAITAAPLTLHIAAPSGGGGGSGGGTGDGGTGPDAAVAPLLLAAADAGAEDQPLALRVTLAGAATDGRAERLGLRVEGVPDGARLSAGLRDPDSGAWIVTPAELAGLALVPPADFAGEIHLRLRGLAVQPDGTTTTAEQALTLTVAPVADAALIAIRPVDVREDAAIALNLSITPLDADGSESVTAVVLSGLPPGARLAPGAGVTALGGGRWAVDPAALGEVRLLPPDQFSGRLSLSVQAVTQEAGGGSRATTAVLWLDVAPMADAPQVAARNAQGVEDRPVALSLDAALVDRDGSETLSLVLEGLPPGARLSAGINNGDGSWTLTPAQLPGLVLTPPHDWSGNMALTLVAHAMEGADASTATSRAPFLVTIAAVADLPGLEVPATLAGSEDATLPLALRARLGDTDGSETLTLRITGVPAGAGFTAGTDNGDGSWTIPGDAVATLGFRPPPDFSGTLRLGLSAIATEAAGGSAATAAQELVISVAPVTDAPLLALSAAPGQEDMPTALSIAAAPADADGSESLLRVLVQGLPGGASLSAGTRQSNGDWLLLPAQLAGLTVTPPTHFSGDLSLRVTAVAAEVATGVEASTTATLALHVAPVADAPLLTAPATLSGTEDTSLALPLATTLVDADGSERLLALRITGLPAGFTLSAGQAEADGGWSVAPAALPGLTLRPAADWNGTLRLTVQSTSEEIANGARATTSRDVVVTLAAVNDAPVLSLVAAPAATAGATEAGVLAQATAQDVDSPQMAGAVVTLSGGQGGDRLGFEGFALHRVGGHLMVGDTGIEVMQDGFDAATGKLVLHGAAPPAAYAAVLQALVLETAAPGGLAAGARGVSVVLQDSAGAESAHQSVTLAVEAPHPPEGPQAMIEPPAAMLGWADAALDTHAVASTWVDHESAATVATLVAHDVLPAVPEPGLPPLEHPVQYH